MSFRRIWRVLAGAWLVAVLASGAAAIEAAHLHWWLTLAFCAVCGGISLLALLHASVVAHMLRRYERRMRRSVEDLANAMEGTRARPWT